MKVSIILLLTSLSTVCYAQWQSNGIPVCDTSANRGFYMLPQIASDGNGGVFVCWRDARRGGFDIYMQHIYSNGSMQFPHNGTVLCNAPYNQEFPRMISDGRGGSYIAWEDSRSMTNSHIYVQRIDSAGEALWTLNGVRAAETGGLFISLALEPMNGGVLLGWSTVADVFIQRLDSLGNRMWGDSGVQVTNRTGNVEAGGVAVTYDASGGMILVWAEGISINYEIFTQRIDSAGKIQWPANGITLSNPTEASGAVAISSDLTGGAIVSWSGGMGGIADTTYHYAQRVSLSGAKVWGRDPVRLGPIGAGGIKRNNTDGRGGAFLGFGRMIQHVDSFGTLLWPGYGTAFTDSQTGLGNSSQVTDNRQGIWNFWAQGGASLAISGQYIDSSGNRQWGAQGMPICTDVDFQDYPRAASDGADRAILVWDDFRNGQSNVYAASVDRSGVVTSVGEESDLIPTVLQLNQNYPNPFNPETTISFSLPSTTLVTLKVYDVLGRDVATLVQDRLSPGRHEFRFSGKSIPSGFYFYRLNTDRGTLAKQMVYLK